MPVGGSFIGDAQQLRTGSPEPLASLTNDQHQQAASPPPGPAPATTGGRCARPLAWDRSEVASSAFRDHQTAARGGGCSRLSDQPAVSGKMDLKSRRARLNEGQRQECVNAIRKLILPTGRIGERVPV